MRSRMVYLKRPSPKSQTSRLDAAVEKGYETVIKVKIIRKAMQENNRRLFTCILTCVNSVLFQLYKRFPVRHRITFNRDA